MTAAVRVTPSRLSPSFSQLVRLRVCDRPGAFAAVATAIGEAGGSLGEISLLAADNGSSLRELSFSAADAQHAERILASLRALPEVTVEETVDRTLQLHRGGKLEIAATVPLDTPAALAMAYTPGVARASLAIAADPDRVDELTIRRNSVAVVTDGTAVLGLGDIGPYAALPVMEGKAILFKRFAGIDAWPICLATTDTDAIVAAVTAIAPGFGGINLEDISAPRCFEIERRLQDALDIPVFHDDQQGTAVVILAALRNALRVVDKQPENLKIVISGVGAAGTATTEMLLRAGFPYIIGCDREGAVYHGRPGNDCRLERYAEQTNPEQLTGRADELLTGADVYIGLSAPGAVSRSGISRMADQAIVFALANPAPEIAPEEIADLAAVIATGRSDYPNQINNVLAFPGIFRGALDSRAAEITDAMKLAASRAIADLVEPATLQANYIIPSVFDPRVVAAVAAAVRGQAPARPDTPAS